jgi:isopropylmalate/homocitrate/citramalate synthase
MSLPDRIRITEVGPRDGLQNENAILAVEEKVAFVDALSEIGVAEIEVSSFVNPKSVPQMADAAEVFRRIRRRRGVVYSALVPNEQGLERALEAHVDKLAVFTAASETFSQRNVNASIAETIDRFRPVVKGAKAAGLLIRGYISCAVRCPYEGPVEPESVRGVAQSLLQLGVDEIDLGDTIGAAVPTDIDRLYEALAGLLSPEETTLHLHDTRGTALACAYRAMQLGVASFDASCGGLGGCPFAPGAAGNLATEDLVSMCGGMEIETGVCLKKLLAAARLVSHALGRAPSSRVYAAECRERAVAAPAAESRSSATGS